MYIFMAAIIVFVYNYATRMRNGLLMWQTAFCNPRKMHIIFVFV